MLSLQCFRSIFYQESRIGLSTRTQKYAHDHYDCLYSNLLDYHRKSFRRTRSSAESTVTQRNFLGGYSCLRRCSFCLRQRVAFSHLGCFQYIDTDNGFSNSCTVFGNRSLSYRCISACLLADKVTSMPACLSKSQALRKRVKKINPSKGFGKEKHRIWCFSSIFLRAGVSPLRATDNNETV